MLSKNSRHRQEHRYNPIMSKDDIRIITNHPWRLRLNGLLSITRQRGTERTWLIKNIKEIGYGFQRILRRWDVEFRSVAYAMRILRKLVSTLVWIRVHQKYPYQKMMLMMMMTTTTHLKGLKFYWFFMSVLFLIKSNCELDSFNLEFQPIRKRKEYEVWIDHR